MTGIYLNDGAIKYYDKNGTELFEGDSIMFDSETTPKTLYRTEDGTLGTDATNPSWIASGRALPCEYGIYPLEDAEMSCIAKVL